MGIELIIDIIRNYFNVNIDEYKDSYYHIAEDGKLIFFYGYENITDINKFVENLDIDDFYENFSGFLTTKDKEEIVSLKAFLWDLYIIYINCSEENSISDIEKYNVERDRFVARKIIIDDINKKIIEMLKKMDETDLDEISLVKKKLVDRVGMIINPESQLDRFIINIEEPEDSINSTLEGLLADKGFKGRLEKLELDESLTIREKVLYYLKYISENINQNN